jgi:dTDP-4-dehydrorhamnose 3,5-epimerase
MKLMKIHEAMIPDARVFELTNHTDNRGYFTELYKQRFYEEIGLKNNWCQVNYSYSKAKVVRGIHIAPYAKLVSCLSGQAYDVVVDMRPDSPAYLKWFGVQLSPHTRWQVYVPPFCGHGFYAYEDNTIIHYLQDGYYDPEKETSVNWQDETINIIWPYGDGDNYTISDKDKTAPRVK